VDDGGCAGLIHKIDVKVLAGRERDARFSVRPDEAEYSGRFAVDGQSSGAGSQAKLGGVGFGRGSRPRYPQEGDRTGHRNAGRKNLPAGSERVPFILSHCSLPNSITFGNWPPIQSMFVRVCCVPRAIAGHMNDGAEMAGRYGLAL